MKLKDLLYIKLENDVREDLKQLFCANTLNLSIEQYNNICKIKYKEINPEINLLSKEKKCKYKSENRCCARIWDSHYGTRCRYKRFGDTEHCNHHNKMLKRTGKLLFNRYDEEKPIFNEKGNKIPWFDNTNMEILDNIIQEQHRNLLKLINKQ